MIIEVPHVLGEVIPHPDGELKISRIYLAGYSSILGSEVATNFYDEKGRVVGLPSNILRPGEPGDKSRIIEIKRSSLIGIGDRVFYAGPDPAKQRFVLKGSGIVQRVAFIFTRYLKEDKPTDSLCWYLLLNTKPAKWVAQPLIAYRSNQVSALLKGLNRELQNSN